MNLKQLLEDWIGEDKAQEILNGVDITLHCNAHKAELRASLPSLLAKIEQHALEQRLVELDLFEQALNQGRNMELFKLARLKDLTKRLDALLNTKEQP